MNVELQKGNYGRIEDGISVKDKDFIDDAIMSAISYSLLDEELSSGVYTSEHGIHHWARTAAYATMIYDNVSKDVESEDNVEKWQVIVAGVCHDLGRIGESADPQHGTRGVMRAAMAMQDIVDAVFIPPDSLMQGEILHAIMHHCDPTKGDNNLTRILKDADKLDILRDGQNRLNTSKLYFPYSLKLVEYGRTWSVKEWEFADGLHNT